MDFLEEFAEWMEDHPIKAMIFITIPTCIITSVVTTLLLT